MELKIIGPSFKWCPSFSFFPFFCRFFHGERVDEISRVEFYADARTTPCDAPHVVFSNREESRAGSPRNGCKHLDADAWWRRRFRKSRIRETISLVSAALPGSLAGISILSHNGSGCFTSCSHAENRGGRGVTARRVASPRLASPHVVHK